MSLQDLHIRLTGDASGVKAAATSAKLYLDEFGNTFTTVKLKAENMAAGSAAALDKLRKSFDPLYANTKRYEAAVAELDKQLDLFKKTNGQAGIGLQEYNRLLEQSARHIYGLDAPLQNYNSMIRTSRFHTANLAAQFNDIGVMLAAGQNPFMLAVQQGTQITQVLENMGGTAKQQFGALKTALFSLISPTQLLTIGIIAGGAALIQWGISALTAKKDAESLKDIVGALEASVSAVDTALENARLSLTELGKEFGTSAKLARDLYKAQLDLAIFESQNKLGTSTKAINESFAALKDYYAGYEETSKMVVLTSEDAMMRTAWLANIQKKVTEEYGLTLYQATLVIKALEDINAKNDPELMAAGARALYAALKDAQDRGQEIPQTMIDTATEALNAAIEALKLKGYIEEAEELAQTLSEIDLKSNIEAATGAAYALATAYEAARKAASTIPALPSLPSGLPKELQPGYITSQVPVPQTLYGNQLSGVPSELQGYVNPQDDLGGVKPIERPMDLGDTDGTGGGGGGRSTDSFEERLEKMREELAMEAEVEMQNYLDRQSFLEEALDKKLLTQQEYDALMEAEQQRHQDAMSSIDAYKYGDSLLKAETFMGDMAAALQNGNEGMLKAARAFGAAEALINAWRAFDQVLADSTLPWWAKIPKALAVLSAGMGAVNAIKSGSSTASAASSAGAASAAAAAPVASAPNMTANYTITGDVIGKQTGGELIKSINEALKAGYQINLEWV